MSFSFEVGTFEVRLHETQLLEKGLECFIINIRRSRNELEPEHIRWSIIKRYCLSLRSSLICKKVSSNVVLNLDWLKVTKTWKAFSKGSVL